jgi:hypothetical protein
MEGTDTVYFVFEGSIREFEGSIMGLQCQLSDNEWEQIINETISYKVFLKCLKRTGMPLLGEKWDDDDDQFIVGLAESVSAMKKLDPILASSVNEKKLKKIYTVKMKDGADSMNELVKNVIKDLKNSKRSEVSDL